MPVDIDFAQRTLIQGPGDELAIRFRQDISDEVIDHLKAQKEANDSRPTGDMFHVGSVPDWLFLKWMHEGYDARLEPVAETLKRLRAEASVFALTDRRI
jgi:hypothetical protein